MIQACLVDDLKEALSEKPKGVYFVDVRTPEEFAKGHIEGVVNIPLGSPANAWDGIGKRAQIYVLCLSGGRSQQACAELEAMGYENLFNVQGGMLAWRAKGFPVINA